jgi:UDP-2,3-diacylglucosamine hydrolase
MQPGKKIYFASDFHLGAPKDTKSAERERLICKWLDEIKADAEEVYLVGDMFDFWYEYKYTIPKGFVRLLGKIAEFTDSGIKVYFFSGNHDAWMEDYFVTELNVSVHHDPITKTYNGKNFYIGHGDGLGPGDNWYKFLKSIFRSKISHWLFSRIHPNLAFWIARSSSLKSRAVTGNSDEKFEGAEKEWLYLYCKDYLTKNKIDYFVFGHRHLPLELDIEKKATYINLGDWLKYNTYAVFDGNKLELKYYKG